jgi:hypothetical protein
MLDIVDSVILGLAKGLFYTRPHANVGAERVILTKQLLLTSAPSKRQWRASWVESQAPGALGPLVSPLVKRVEESNNSTGSCACWCPCTHTRYVLSRYVLC